jgi:antiviral helicase SKI2
MDDLFNLDDYADDEVQNINKNDEEEKKEEKKNEEKKEEEKEEKKEEKKEVKENINIKEKEEKKENANNEIKEEKKTKKSDNKENIKKNIIYAIEDKVDVKKFDEIDLAMKFPFQLDDFQKRGIIRVENHENVLVCAHTSSGKTVVAEYGIAITRRNKKRIIYTAPIKALSNQKYRDFKEKFGDVGVVTGDVSINPDAQCLILTTEILQNMIYRQSEKLRQVDYVIFDEVHYINDTERGHVWEEILILLPQNIGLIMLSATIPNYLDFAKWIGSIKKSTIYIEITYKRVVPLEHKIYVNNKKVFTILNTSQNLGKVDQDAVYKAMKCAEEENKKIYSKKGDYSTREKRKQRQQKIIDQIKTFQKFLVKREQDEFNEKYSKVENNTITQTHFKIEEMALYIKNQNLFPAVMFTFSIKKIDEYARMLSKTQFTSQPESQKIISFFDKCISKLSPHDRKIGQIQALRQLLPTGVGVHHSGLLPILKECVEILYSKGLIKILFATTSFSIGLNMPTRTVIFTDITKYNSGKKEILSSSEYLQMCGRAGRRGKDDKGYIFILITDKNAELEPMKLIGMASGSGTIVESQFRLSYKVIINFFYRNVKNIVQFFKESYIENSTFISMPKIKKKIEELEEKTKKLKGLECKNDIETMTDYYMASSNVRKCRNKLYRSEYIISLFKTKGRIILYNSKKSLKNIYVLVVNHYIDYNGEIWCLRVDGDENVVTEYENSKEAKMKSNQGQFARKGIKNGKYFAYFTIYYEDVVDICDYTLKCFSKKNSRIGDLNEDDEGFEFYLDKNLNIILDELLSINNDLDNKKSTIKIVNYVKVSKNDLSASELAKEKESLSLIESTNPCHECLLRENHYLEYKANKGIYDELESNKKKIKEDNLKYFKEFQSRIKILKSLGYIDEENNLTLKGKAAREINCCDCLIVTELLFSNILDKLSVEETTAFLSCFISNSNHISFEDPEISEEFTNAIEKLKEINSKINEQEIKAQFEESSYNRRIDFSLAPTIKSWMEGAHFSEILEECDLEEGKVYSMINRLSGFFDSICEFYNVLGNNTLGEKFVNAKAVLLRDVMTSQSLYLQDDLNVKELD